MIAAGISSFGTAIGSTTLAAVTAASVNSWMLSTALSLSLSYASMALTPKQSMQSGGISTDVTTSGSDVARSFILGTYATNGHLIMPPFVYDTDKDDNKYLTYVLDISDAPIDSIIEWQIDGKVRNLEPKRNPGDSGYHPDDQFGQSFDGELSRVGYAKYHDGTQTAADPTLLQFFSTYPDYPVNENFIMKGVAYAITTFKYLNDDPKYSGMPVVRMVVRGKPLYDPRKDTTAGGSGSHRWGDEGTYEYTDNPIVMVYNLLRGITIAPGHVYGVGVAGSSLPQARWFAAMNVCDEAGSAPSAENWFGDRKRYRAGIEISVDQEPLSVIEELLKSCGATLADAGGQYIIVTGAPNASSTHITDDVILIDTPTSFSITEGLQNIYNGVTAGYPDPRKLWEEQDAVPLFNATWEAEDDGQRQVAAVKFPAVPYPTQVRRRMREMAADNRRQRQHSIGLPPTYINIQPTDTISWTSEKNGYSSKLFEVLAKVVDPMTLSVVLQLRERNPADYDFDAVSDGRLPTIPPLTPSRPVYDGVAGFSAVATVLRDANGVARRPAIQIMWSTQASYAGITYTIRLRDGGTAVTSGSISDLTIGSIITADGILANTGYEVRARARVRGAHADQLIWSDWMEVITGDVRMNRDDIADDILDDLAALEASFDGVEAQIEGLANDTDALVNQARSDISDDMDALELRLNQEIQTGVETGITEYDTTVQGQFESVAGQIQQLQASLTSNDLLLNGSFQSGDLTGWTLTAGGIGVIAKADSTIPLMATCPKDYAANIGSGRGLTQSLQGFTVAADDRLQLRFSIAGAGGQLANRRATIDIEWIAADSTSISTETQTFTTPNATSWHVATMTFDPPDNAVNANLTIRNAGNSTYWLMTGIECMTYDASISSRVTDLEVATANTSSTLAGYIDSANVRFGEVEGSIGAEAAARANAVSAVVLSVNTLAGRVNTNESSIVNLGTTVTDNTNAIADLSLRMTSTFGDVQLVRDPYFDVFEAGALPHWDGGLEDSSRIFARNTSSENWWLSQMPGNGRAFALYDADTAGMGSNYFPVSPADRYDFGYYYGARTNGPIARAYIQWVDDSFTQVGTTPVLDLNSRGSYNYASSTNNAPSAGATKGRLIFKIASAGGSGLAGFITGLTVKKQSAFEYTTRAMFTEQAQTIANNNVAFTNYISTANSRFNNLQANVSSQAVAINQRATIAQMNSAISSLNSSVSAEVGRISAQGRLRVYSMANTIVGGTRIGLSAEAVGESSSTAALYLEADSTGASSVYVLANRFSIVNTSGSTMTRTTPFYVYNGDCYIESAVIRDATITRLKIGENQLYVPRLYTRSDVTLSDATNSGNSVLLFNQTIPDFEGGGYMIAFNGIVDSNINYDSFGRFQMLIDNTVVQTGSAGIRVSGANGGGHMSICLIASYSGSGTTNIKIRGWSHSSGDLSGNSGNADCIIRNMTLTVSGTRR